MSKIKRMNKSDGQVNGMTFLSPMYATGVHYAEPMKPHGFSGSIPDPMGYFDHPTFLAGSYGKPGKSKKKD